MKILQVIPTYAPAWCYGGPIRAVHDLSTALVRRGHEIHVYTTDGNGPERLPILPGVETELDGVRVRYFRSCGPRRMHFAPAMSRALDRRVLEFDAVHLHSVFLWPTAAAARAAEGKGVPYVISPRGMLVKELVRRRSRIAKSAWIRLVERRTIEGAAAVHVTSSIELRELRRFGLRLPRVESIPNGVTLPTESEPCSAAPTRDVLFLGRLDGKKRVDLLLRSIAAVPGVCATIAGPDDGERSALIALRDRLGLGGTVEIRGPAYGEEKDALLRGHKLLAITSIQENFGNVVTEAMSFGLPVVATDQVGAAELLVRHHAGIVCAGEERAVSAAIQRALSDKDLRRAMGDRAREASRRYSWDRIAASFEACYERAASSKTRVATKVLSHDR